MRTLFISLAAMALFVSCAGDKKEPSGKISTTQKDPADNKNDLTPKGEPSLIGRWRPVEMNLKGISEDERRDMKANIILEFTQEGNYTGYNKENKQEGTYSYDPATKKMSVKSNTNSRDNENFTIGWEADLLLMTNDEGTVKLRRE